MRIGRSLFFSVTLLAIILASTVVLAQEQDVNLTDPPNYEAIRVNPHPPVIDGDLSDEIWNSANMKYINTMWQIEPDNGAAPTESTKVAICYDDDAVYFAFWVYDSEPDKIRKELVRRDRWGESDIVTIRLDPYHDHQTGFRFDVSAAGCQRDDRIFKDNQLDNSWNGVWESDVSDQPWGWSAEVKVPYYCLRFTEQDEHTWGMNVTRYISRRGESDWWAYRSTEESGFVSEFGHLTGLSGIKPARHLEIMPYAVSGVETEPKHVFNPDGKDYMKNVGFDLKYGLSSNLILDMTINPDFGQVELDRPVLNLTAFETWYPEQRPFFMEGLDLFNTSFDLFYTRRIGKSPGNDVDDDALDDYTNYPNSITILGAAKITGKLGGKTAFAFLNAVTQEETAEYVDTLGNTKTGVVEPAANYSVFRVKQDIFANSTIGGMFTLAAQDTYKPVNTGGIDWNFQTPDNMWAFEGQYAYSHNEESELGHGVVFQFEKNSGKHTRGSIGIEYEDTKLDLNKLGFIGRNDYAGGWAWMQYRTNDDWFIFRNTYHNFNFYTGSNNAGYRISNGGNYNFYIDFTNWWNFGGGVNYDADRYDDHETRDNGVWRKPGGWSWWASLNTDERKKVGLNLNPGSGQSRGGSWWAHYTGLVFKPYSNMNFSFGVNVYKENNVIRWVENTDADTSVFADFDQEQITLNFSSSILFSRDLSFQLSARGLISGQDYFNYRSYLGEEIYSAPYGGYDEDYSYAALNSTMILRWEYMPGSTLFLVWTRSFSDSDDTLNNLDLSRDMKRVFSEGADNVFLVKASYWWNL